MGVPMEGFFNGADVVFATPAPSTAAYEVPAKAPTPPTEPVPREKGTHTEGVSETTPISAKTPAPLEIVISPATVQTKAASPVLPLVISTSDPFAALSQAVKDGSSLVVTPSSILSSATRRPDTDLSSEGSDDILEDPDDALVLRKGFLILTKRRVLHSSLSLWVGVFPLFLLSSPFPSFVSSYMNLHCSLLPFICMSISPFAETFEGLGIATDVGMPTPAIPVAPIPVIPSAPVSVVPTVLVSAVPATPIPTGPGKFPFPFTFSFIFICESVLSRSWFLILPCAFLIGPLPTALSQFEVGSSSATISDPANEAAAFFARFD